MMHLPVRMRQGACLHRCMGSTCIQHFFGALQASSMQSLDIFTLLAMLHGYQHACVCKLCKLRLLLLHSTAGLRLQARYWEQTLKRLMRNRGPFWRSNLTAAHSRSSSLNFTDLLLSMDLSSGTSMAGLLGSPGLGEAGPPCSRPDTT